MPDPGDTAAGDKKKGGAVTGGGGGAQAAGAPGKGTAAGGSSNSAAQAAKAGLEGISRAAGVAPGKTDMAKTAPAPSKTANLGTGSVQPGISAPAANIGPQPSVPATAADLDMAAKLAVAESASIKDAFGNMSIPGVQGVMETVKNRSLATGKSVTDVISAPKQFSPVADGSLAAVDPNSQNYKTALSIAKSVFDGTMPSMFGGMAPENYGNLDTINNKSGYSSPTTKAAFNGMDIAGKVADATNPTSLSHTFGTIGGLKSMSDLTGAPTLGTIGGMVTPASQKAITDRVPPSGVDNLPPAGTLSTGPEDPVLGTPNEPTLSPPTKKTITGRVYAPPSNFAVPEKVLGIESVPPGGSLFGGLQDWAGDKLGQATDAVTDKVTNVADNLQSVYDAAKKWGSLIHGDGLPHKSMVGESRGRPSLGTEKQQTTQQMDPMTQLWYQLLIGDWTV